MPKSTTPRSGDGPLGRRGLTNGEILNEDDNVNESNEGQPQTLLRWFWGEKNK